MTSREGSIVAVLSSLVHGYPTYPHALIEVEMLGIKGDAHSGKLRDSFTNPGTTKLNDRPISILSWEIMQAANESLRLNMQPGDFNEQLLVKGLGDLGWVALGSVVTFAGSSVTLEVVDYAYPCTKLATHNESDELAKFLMDNSVRNQSGKPYSKRGILARVINPGILQPNMSVAIA